MNNETELEWKIRERDEWQTALSDARLDYVFAAPGQHKRYKGSIKRLEVIVAFLDKDIRQMRSEKERWV